MIGGALALLGWAGAQDVPAEPPPPEVSEAAEPLAEPVPAGPDAGAPPDPLDPGEPDEVFAEEITVYGENAVRQARWDLIMALKREGWDPRDKPGGRTAFKPPRRWMGRGRLDADGNLSFTRPVVRLEKVELGERQPSEPVPAFDRDIGGNVVEVGSGTVSTLPTGNAGLWVLPSKALLDRAYARVRRAVQPEMEQLARVQRDTAIKATVDAIPGDLDALWTRGVPLYGSVPVLTESERRSTILGYWATRADTDVGRQATLVIERWIRNTLVDDHAPSSEEIARAEAERADGRKLTL